MLKQLLAFYKLIGIKLITILYYLGLISIALALLAQVLSGLPTVVYYSFIDGVRLVGFSFILASITLILWRIIFELGLLSFRMADDLREIKLNKLGPPPASK